MGYSFFAYIARMKHIKRWGLMRNSMSENLCEHSYMTSVLAHALGVIRRDVVGLDCDPNLCATMALYHDATEILTGDLPTPVKYHSELMRKSYRTVESMARSKLADMLPREMKRALLPLIREDCEADVLLIVKAADKLSAYIKCLEELQAGNGEFKKAAEQIKTTLDAMDLPELRYFEQNFLPAFALTLDELE